MKNKQRISYSIIFIIFWHLVISTQNNYMHLKKYREENEIMKQGLEAIGGFTEEELKIVNDQQKYTERWIKNHGLLKYHWVYEIGYPVVTPAECYIRSEFGQRLYQNRWAMHYGIDIVSKYDLRVVAVKEGIVKKIDDNSIYGNCIEIRHDHLETFYAHLSVILVEEGQKINAGDIIGIMGNTGQSLGVHLHFEIRAKNERVNPVSNSTYRQWVEN